jgi:uncharacterized protein (TIGR02246 family)
MNLHRRTLRLLAALTIATACAQATGARRAPATPPGDAAAVRRAFEKLVQSFNAKDAQAVMSSFAEDVILSYPERPDAGYREISEAFRKMFAPRPGVTETWAAEVEEIQVSGDMAFVRVTWTYSAARKNPDRQVGSREKDLEIWRRQADGSWKLTRGLSYPLRPSPAATPK